MDIRQLFLPRDVELAYGVGYVYVWTNRVSGRMYIGSHKGTNPRYLASGIAIRAAFDSYGMETFERRFLYVGDRYAEMEEYFLHLVDAADNPMYYNLKNDALGVRGLVGEKNPMWGKRSANYGKRMTRAQKEKLSSMRKGADNPFWGRTHSEDTLELLRQKSTGENNAFYGKRHDIETTERIANSLRGRPSWNKGISPSTDARASQSRSMKNKPKVQCPVCGVQCDPSNAKRWHFDNCKPYMRTRLKRDDNAPTQ